MGQENVKLSHEQMARVSALLKKETLVDEMEQVRQQLPLAPSSPRVAGASSQQQPQESGKKSSISPSNSGDTTTTTGLDNEKGEKRKERVAQ